MKPGISELLAVLVLVVVACLIEDFVVTGVSTSTVHAVTQSTVTTLACV